METKVSDYLQYRGKCKEMSEALVASDSNLRLVRGWYHCPLWGRQAHWWAEAGDGQIFDPTVKQFPTAGAGAQYVEYDGHVSCEYCGEEVHEHDAYFVDHHVYCSEVHYARDIGF